MRAVSRFVVAMAVAAAAVLLGAGDVRRDVDRPPRRCERGAAPRSDVVPIPGQPATYKRFYAPAHYTPPGGPRFNNPYGSQSRRGARCSPT